MTQDEVREHNEYCTDDEIIWCDCVVSFSRFDWCEKCGGALPGIWLLTDKVPNAQGKQPTTANATRDENNG